MVLDIVKYGHPALRARGRAIEAIDSKVQELVEDMLETMRAADGVGLAAQQIGRPVQVCVVDVTGVSDRPSSMSIAGQPVNPEDYMPLALINPEIELLDNEEAGPEGCLSFPGLQADISRPQRVQVSARLPDGSQLSFEAGGLLSRAIQHEFDHLQGVLFIDRMNPTDRKDLAAEIESIASGI